MRAWSGYDGANWSTNRGYVYFPTLNTKRDLSDYTLTELRKKSRWLYNNVGLATRIIDGIANMVGALTPIPLTGDKEWNELALKNFTNNAGAEFVFDVSGKFNFWSAQKMMTRSRLLNGDILAVLTETASKIARVMFYEAHQVGNASDTPLQDQDQWNVGVRTGAQNQALAYRILTEEGQKSVDIPAADAILLADLRWPCRQRGEPIMRHAVNNLLDRAEIIGFIKTSSKNASMIGYQIVRDPTAGTYPNRLPALGAGPIEETLEDGTKVMVEDAYKPGKVPVNAPGEEIKMLLDQRPSPNQMEFMDYLVRDICAGTPFSADLLWNIAKLGGATARYVIADAQKAVEGEQTLNADLFCERFWAYYIAKELKMGRLRPCQDPEWWKVGWQPEQKLTVDIGRDGALYLEMHKAGMISLQRFFGAAYGANWKPEMDQHLNERKYIVDKVAELGLTMDEAFAPQPGAPSQRSEVRDQRSETRDPTSDLRPQTSSPEDSFFKKMLALMATKKTEAPVNVHLPVMNIPDIHIPKPEIQVNLPEQKAPIVHVHNVVEPAPPAPAPVVHVAAPVVNIPAPIVNVAAPHVTVTTPKTKSVKFKRDGDGKIVGAETEKE